MNAAERAYFRSRPVPDKLVRALSAAPLVPEHELEDFTRTHPYTIPVDDSLTLREKQVLVQLADGLEYDQIAERLGLSGWTVRQYARRLRYRLHARNNNHAIAISFRKGVLV